MNTETRDDDYRSGRTELSPEDIFDLLSVTRRRHALGYLAETVGTTTLHDLSDALATAEGNVDETHRRRIVIGLYHSHLPKLAAAGVVRYDASADRIELLPAADRLTPYLDRNGDAQAV